MIEIKIDNEVTAKPEVKDEASTLKDDKEWTPQQNRPRHRLEERNRSFLENLREGPYITHNVLITHAEFLKSANKDAALRVYRIFPTGGGYNYCGDIFALITWYFIVVFIITAIPLACFCENSMLNISNAIILTIILMYHLVAIYGVTKNKKKFRRAAYIAETPADKYLGLQNHFEDVSLDGVLDTSFLNSLQKQKIVTMLSERKGASMLVMLCTKSYWKNRVIAPTICLSLTAILCLIGIFVQVVTLGHIET